MKKPKIILKIPRKSCENESQVRKLQIGPSLLRSPEGIEVGELPTLQGLYNPRVYELALSVFPKPEISTNFHGGETAGLKRVSYYFWEKDLIQNYKETRNGMLGMDFSSKFSPWLALGCVR